MVCEPSLVKLAEKLEFHKYIFLGRGEEATGGRHRPSILADVFESFVGALFIDQGLLAVKTFMSNYILPVLQSDPMYAQTDYKTMLQEHVQHKYRGNLYYAITDEQGPSHDKQFLAQVWINQILSGEGKGKTKKEAEQQAAFQALRNVGVVDINTLSYD